MLIFVAKMTRDVPGGSPAPASPAPTGTTEKKPTPATGPTGEVKLQETFRCSPADLYAALLEAPRIAAYTQAQARVDRSVGGTFEILGGSITGTFVELV